MNREIKRRMRREQGSADKLSRTAPRAPAPGQQRERVRARQFIREIQGELRRVVWPTRPEVFTYAAVVIVIVLIMTGIIFVMDFGFAQAAFQLFRPVEAPVAP